MNVQSISINTSFNGKKPQIGDWNSLSKYRPQSWNSLSEYKPLELEKNYRQLYEELDSLHKQAFWDGALSVFNGGSVHEIDFSRLRKLFSIQRSKINKQSSSSIADAWKKVGDTLRNIMGGK